MDHGRTTEPVYTISSPGAFGLELKRFICLDLTLFETEIVTNKVRLRVLWLDEYHALESQMNSYEECSLFCLFVKKFIASRIIIFNVKWSAKEE